MWPWCKTVLGAHFGIGEFTTHFSRDFSGGLGCSLGVTGFDPWPCLGSKMNNWDSFGGEVEFSFPV